MFKITRQDLKDKLNACFLVCDSKYYLDKVFPFMIDQLTKDPSRAESLEIMEKLIFNSEFRPSIEPHLEMTISVSMNEYFNRFEIETQRALRQSLTRILTTIEMKVVFQESKDLSHMMSKCFKSDSVAISMFTKKVVDVCMTRVQEDPSGMPAVLASKLMSEIIGNSTLPDLSKNVFIYAFDNQQNPERSILANVKK